jgi:hypothetical protein
MLNIRITIVTDIILDINPLRHEHGRGDRGGKNPSPMAARWTANRTRPDGGYNPAARSTLGHKIVVRGAWGSAQSIMRMNGQLMGASDTRQRGSLAAGY